MLALVRIVVLVTKAVGATPGTVEVMTMAPMVRLESTPAGGVPHEKPVLLVPGAPHTLLMLPPARHATEGFVRDLLKP